MKKLALYTGFFLVNSFSFYMVLSLSSCGHKKVAGPGHFGGPAAEQQAQAAGVAIDDPQVLTGSRQLTFKGLRAGEGYFSADGSKMVFQSEREPGNPFYQIYLMDLASGETERISPGPGKTTCAWIHPSGDKVLFASTHLDKELPKKVEAEWQERKSPNKSKYSWSFDDKFDIFEKDLKSKTFKRLTQSPGYDAEGDYSPDGKWIVFASNRSAYTEKLSAEEQKLFQQDPSYMMDIYIMKSDGTEVRQLTKVRGYDGGPFFSADGKKITWRRFAPNGQSAEIYVMNVDGSEQKPITNLKSMSWAPYFHPSGKYIVFTTNLLGYSNFELYIVDSEGKKAPVRVSYLPDFDGLPVFAPNGKQISWTHRNEKGESQIYMADWNHEKALELLDLPKESGAADVLRLTDYSHEIRESDVKRTIEYLASPQMSGRLTGSPEEKVYANNLAELFKTMGLSPVADSYISEFDFTSGVELGEGNSLQISLPDRQIKGEPQGNYTPLSLSKEGSVAAAGVTFAGYGLFAAASEKEALYDSYKSADVKGKWVLIFRDIPENVPNSKRLQLNLYSRIQHKVLEAKQRGAVGVLVAAGPNSGSRQKIMKLRYDGATGESAIPVLSVSDELANDILVPTGRSLKQWQDILDQGEIQSTDVPKVQIAANVKLIQKKTKAQQVLAQIRVKGATKSLVIGAHGDHLGRGQLGGSSLAKNDEKDMIHLGADDNASGVAGVIELAHHLSALHKAGKIRLQQNLIFAVWSGEEIGLLGSSHWLKTVQPNKISAYLNMDMIGRYRDQLLVQGVGSALEWKDIFEQLARQTPLKMSLMEDPYLPSDSMAFYMKQIPTVMFFTGSHGEYHSPRDTADRINYAGEVEILNLMEKLILKISTVPPGSREVKISYVKAESSRNPLEGRRFRVYLGTIPDYAQEGVKGVRISGTSKESPAEKAGLQPGDVIVELAGLKIENLYDYVYGLQSLKANQPVPVRVVRSGKQQDLSITPQLKE